jgi:hypothetical protein
MTGFRHKSFRYDCGQSQNCYIQSLPSWDFLDGVFPRGIIPTDIDGMVEVNGHLLFLEEKRAGAGPKTGQLSAFRALSRLPGVKVAMTGVVTYLPWIAVSWLFWCSLLVGGWAWKGRA